MPKLYRTREGDATAVDTRTQLTTVGSETAPGQMTIQEMRTAYKLLGLR